MMIDCPSCKKQVTIEVFLDHACDFQKKIGTIKFECPHCNERIDAKLENNKIVLGYVYGAGEAHFNGMINYDVL